MEAALAMILVLTLVNTVMHLAILDGINGVNMIRKMGNSIGVAINEIQSAIDEIRQNGEHHAEFVRSNGELVIAGLEMALDILNSAELKPCDDTISRQAAIDLRKGQLMSICDNCVNVQCIFQSGITRRKCDFYIPSAQPEKRYTKADYIMALHKEYGCPLEAAEKAHDAALEYLRSISKLKG